MPHDFTGVPSTVALELSGEPFLPQGYARIEGLGASPSGRLTAGIDHASHPGLAVIDRDTAAVKRIVVGDFGYLLSGAWLDEHTVLLGMSYDCRLRVVDVDTGHVRTLFRVHSNDKSVDRVFADPRGFALFSVGSIDATTSSLYRYDAATRRVTRIGEVPSGQWDYSAQRKVLVQADPQEVDVAEGTPPRLIERPLPSP